MRFTKQTVIVTGGTRGLGRAASLAFLGEGAKVYATYLGNEEAAESMRDAAGDYGEQLVTTRCDVSDEVAVNKFWDSLGGEQVSVLVNNAGIRRDVLLPVMELETWEQVLGTNLTGGYLMAKRAVMCMLRKRYGRILFITSPSGHMGLSGQGNYGASKMGQVGLARSLCKEVGRKGITVNCVSPGFIETDFVGDLSEEEAAAFKEMTASRRFGTPEEVAAAILFLASPEASYVNGATLEVTGGL